jgi:hypothetical protein
LKNTRQPTPRTTEKQKHVEAFREFLSQWLTPFDCGNPTKPRVLDLEAVPACPEGLELLYYFSPKYPTAYEVARKKAFVDVPPAVHRTLGWQAYCEHFAGCADCQEGGAPPIKYEGRGSR